jgi:hypothetical protein
MLRPSQDEVLVARLTMSDWPDEEAWLRGCIIRLRTLLRFAKDERVEAGLKNIIADAEKRLEQLQREQIDPFEDAPGG